MVEPRQTVVKDVSDHNLLGASSGGMVQINAPAGHTYSLYLSLIGRQ